MTSIYFTPLTDFLKGVTSKYMGVYREDDPDNILVSLLPRAAGTRPKMDITYNTAMTVASITLNFADGRVQVLSNIPIAELTNVISHLNTLL